MTDRRDIDHVDLRLDQRNPRHDPVKSQREAIAALLENPTDRDKVINLARHMGNHGPSPIDSLMVIEEGGAYVVLEGNRRTAALKLLHNPDLAQDANLAKRFRQIAASMDVLPSTLSAVVMANREEAREWQLLRHDGEAKGAGVVNWSPEAKQRFNRKPGTHADRGLLVLDAMEKVYSDDSKLMEAIKRVKDAKLTTFGRIVSDPYIRERVGVDINQGNLVRHYPEASLKSPLKRIVSDLDSSLTVSQVKTKELRRQYIAGISSDLPDESEYSASPEPFGDGTSKKKKTTKKGKTKSKKLFGDVSLTNAPQRIQDLVTEIRKLDPKTHPNASAVLVRSVVDLMVEEVHDAKKWTRKQYLHQRIRKCLSELDPSDKDKKYQPVRIGLSDKDSLMSVNTLHAWVHNVHFSPAPADLEATAQNWTPFINGLDGLL